MSGIGGAWPADLADFFAAYRDAFNALDGDAVAALYAVPSAISQDRRTTFWTDAGPIRDNMRALCALYRERGFRRTGFELLACLPMGDDYAVVDLLWTIEWAGAAPPWRFRTGYNLVREAVGWRVLLCSAYAETALHRSP